MAHRHTAGRGTSWTPVADRGWCQKWTGLLCGSCPAQHLSRKKLCRSRTKNNRTTNILKSLLDDWDANMKTVHSDSADLPLGRYHRLEQGHPQARSQRVSSRNCTPYKTPARRDLVEGKLALHLRGERLVSFDADAAAASGEGAVRQSELPVARVVDMFSLHTGRTCTCSTPQTLNLTRTSGLKSVETRQLMACSTCLRWT